MGERIQDRHDYYLELAKKDLKDGQYDSSIRAINKAMNFESTKAALMLRGVAKIRKGNVEEGVEDSISAQKNQYTGCSEYFDLLFPCISTSIKKEIFDYLYSSFQNSSKEKQEKITRLILSSKSEWKQSQIDKFLKTYFHEWLEDNVDHFTNLISSLKDTSKNWNDLYYVFKDYIDKPDDNVKIYRAGRKMSEFSSEEFHSHIWPRSNDMISSRIFSKRVMDHLLTELSQKSHMVEQVDNQTRNISIIVSNYIRSIGHLVEKEKLKKYISIVVEHFIDNIYFYFDKEREIQQQTNDRDNSLKVEIFNKFVRETYRGFFQDLLRHAKHIFDGKWKEVLIRFGQKLEDNFRFEFDLTPRKCEKFPRGSEPITDCIRFIMIKYFLKGSFDEFLKKYDNTWVVWCSASELSHSFVGYHTDWTKDYLDMLSSDSAIEVLDSCLNYESRKRLKDLLVKSLGEMDPGKIPNIGWWKISDLIEYIASGDEEEYEIYKEKILINDNFEYLPPDFYPDFTKYERFMSKKDYHRVYRKIKNNDTTSDKVRVLLESYRNLNKEDQKDIENEILNFIHDAGMEIFSTEKYELREQLKFLCKEGKENVFRLLSRRMKNLLGEAHWSEKNRKRLIKYFEEKENKIKSILEFGERFYESYHINERDMKFTFFDFLEINGRIKSEDISEYKNEGEIAKKILREILRFSGKVSDHPSLNVKDQINLVERAFSLLKKFDWVPPSQLMEINESLLRTKLPEMDPDQQKLKDKYPRIIDYLDEIPKRKEACEQTLWDFYRYSGGKKLENEFFKNIELLDRDNVCEEDVKEFLDELNERVKLEKYKRIERNLRTIISQIIGREKEDLKDDSEIPDQLSKIVLSALGNDLLHPYFKDKPGPKTENSDYEMVKFIKKFINKELYEKDTKSLVWNLPGNVKTVEQLSNNFDLDILKRGCDIKVECPVLNQRKLEKSSKRIKFYVAANPIEKINLGNLSSGYRIWWGDPLVINPSKIRVLPSIVTDIDKVILFAEKEEGHKIGRLPLVLTKKGLLVLRPYLDTPQEVDLRKGWLEIINKLASSLDCDYYVPGKFIQALFSSNVYDKLNESNQENFQIMLNNFPYWYDDLNREWISLDESSTYKISTSVYKFSPETE